MVGFAYGEKLPIHRAFGNRNGGWGEGHIVMTGDVVREGELWWTLANTTSTPGRARWCLGIVLKFEEGYKLVHQRVKILWVESTSTMVNTRMVPDDFPGHGEFEGEGWFVTGQVGTVDIGSVWLPATACVAPASLDEVKEQGDDHVAILGASAHDPQKKMKLITSVLFKPGDDLLEARHCSSLLPILSHTASPPP
jgi:hypothetical protein